MGRAATALEAPLDASAQGPVAVTVADDGAAGKLTVLDEGEIDQPSSTLTLPSFSPTSTPLRTRSAAPVFEDQEEGESMAKVPSIRSKPEQEDMFVEPRPIAPPAVRNPASAFNGYPSKAECQQITARAGAAAFSAALQYVATSGESGEDPTSCEEVSSEEELMTPEDMGPEADDDSLVQGGTSDPTVTSCATPALEGAAGRGRLSVPEAVQEVSSTTVQRRFRQASNEIPHDVRQFIRAGDILNYLGGNRWGHVVLALDPPQAFQAPVLYTAEKLPHGEIPLDVFRAKLCRESLQDPWGLTVEGEEDSSALVVAPEISSAIINYNAGTTTDRIRPGDHIVQVNGFASNGNDLWRIASNLLEMEVKLWSPGLGLKVIAYDVPIFAVKVLQSASNLCDISESTVCIVVHPFTKKLCAAGQGLGGFRINLGHQGPVEVQVLMSPFDNRTLDFALFKLAVNEVVRAPHDQKWSMRTAVRSYLRNAALRPEKYAKASAKVRLGAKLSDHWAVRPICSTVPARIWQKYFLKKAYKDRPLMNESGVGLGNFSAEAAFAEFVLMYMPVKDDRVLPDDLVSILLTTDAWDVLDIVRGPPDRRMHDRPAWASSDAPPGEAGKGDPGGPAAANKGGDPNVWKFWRTEEESGAAWRLKQGWFQSRTWTRPVYTVLRTAGISAAKGHCAAI
eukprot:CAMPEP_0206425658 /NCGR_PEP_ID=MMETSP0324_2-20121206/3920_1 /ASSEMBLY_ACC=CAM_ASM_000836 /TAXON_ID=2866 /ORGANISM="Crypthecodinium cohnii, Strain Seligo" /LENGTH=678 /DNA_ID=CAMNT_0053890477 /DNA_START=108 /DNA_END=2143 /DNA_ORIENTATION=-